MCLWKISYDYGKVRLHGQAKGDSTDVLAAYSSAKHALGSATGVRLEQFFWRIIGSPRLQRSLSEARIAHLHAIISQDTPINTPPKASGTGRLDAAKVDNRHESQTSTARRKQAQPPPSEPHRGDGDVRGTAGQSSKSGQRERSTSRPRPILRVSRVDTTGPSKAAKILTPTRDQVAKGKPASKSGRKEVGESSLGKQPVGSPHTTTTRGSRTIIGDTTAETLAAGESPISQSTSSSSKSSKKTSSFSVNAKKKRPIVLRRRSSQSTSAAAGKSPKAATPSPKDTITPDKSTRSQSYDQTNSPQARELDTISKT